MVLDITVKIFAACIALIIALSVQPTEAVKDAEKYGTQGNIQLPVLIYHNVNPVILDNGTVTPDKFEEDMLYLKALGFNSVSLKELIAYKEGKGKLPQNPVLITLDDGYSDNYLYAYPVLKKLKMKGVIFIIGWAVGKDRFDDNGEQINPHFSWEQAKEMVSSGLIEIQHHTYAMHESGSRPGWPRFGVKMLKGENVLMYRKAFASDCLKLKNLIQSKLNQNVYGFAYPYGEYNNHSEQILKGYDFKATFSTREGVNNLKDGLYLLKRIGSRESISGPALMKKILDYLGRTDEIPFNDKTDRDVRMELLRKLTGQI